MPWYLSSRCGVWKSSLLVALQAQVDQLQQRGHFVARVLVQPDLADAQHVGPVEELGQHGDHLAGEGDVLGLLGVDAQPGVVADAVVGRALRLPLGELAEVVAEAVGAAAVVAHPEGRLADGHAARPGPAPAGRRSCGRRCGCGDRRSAWRGLGIRDWGLGIRASTRRTVVANLLGRASEKIICTCSARPGESPASTPRLRRISSIRGSAAAEPCARSIRSSAAARSTNRERMAGNSRSRTRAAAGDWTSLISQGCSGCVGFCGRGENVPSPNL